MVEASHHQTPLMPKKKLDWSPRMQYVEKYKIVSTNKINIFELNEQVVISEAGLRDFLMCKSALVDEMIIQFESIAKGSCWLHLQHGCIRILR